MEKQEGLSKYKNKLQYFEICYKNIKREEKLSKQKAITLYILMKNINKLKVQLFLKYSNIMHQIFITLKN